MAPSSGDADDQSWRVLLFRAVRDGDLEFMRGLANTHPFAIHEHFCESLCDWEIECESLKWYEFGEATCLYIGASYSQARVVDWLLENGVDRDKSCYHGQKPLDVIGQCPLDVIGQCRLDIEATEAIRHALSAELKRPRAPIAPVCIAKLGYEETVKKVYEVVQTGKGATKRVPRRVTESVATCKVTVSWQTYWLSDVTSSRDGQLGGGVTYELQYRSRVGQDWIPIPTKTPNKTLTGLVPGHVYDFRVRAVNSAGWGDFSSVTELNTPSEKTKGGAKAVEQEDNGVTDLKEPRR